VNGELGRIIILLIILIIMYYWNVNIICLLSIIKLLWRQRWMVNNYTMSLVANRQWIFLNESTIDWYQIHGKMLTDLSDLHNNDIINRY